LSIPDDIPIIERGIRQVGASLVVIDPLMAFLGGSVNSHKDQDIRRALAPLAKMAERTGAAVVIVRHLNKATGGSALYRGGGSIGIIGAARSALLVAEDPEDESRRVLASLKHNLTEPAPSLRFAITTAGNGAARVEWQGETTFGAHDLLRAPADDEEKSALSEAMDFLRDELGEGPMTANTVKENARKADITGATLKRAKQALKVKSEKEGDGSWSWHLPGKERYGKGINDAHASHDEPLEKVLKNEPLEHLDQEHTLHTLRKAYIKEGAQEIQDAQGIHVGVGEPLEERVA
jgi:RecA-family ATPase